MLLGAAALRSLAGGLHIYGFSIFFLPLTRDLGLSRAATSLIFSMSRAQGAVGAPVSGYLIDRFGPRAVMVGGSIMVGIGYLLFAQSRSYLVVLLVYVLLITNGFGAGVMDATMALANNWFARRRALAMGAIGVGISAGGALLTPGLAWVVLNYGWRWASALVGLIFLVAGLPLARMVHNTPESVGLLPDSGPHDAPAQRGGHAAPTSRDYSVRAALRTRAIWILVVANILRVAGFSALTVHFVPILVWKGVSEPTAALYLGATAFLGIPGHLVIGWLADRWSKPLVLSLSMALGAAGVAVLLYGGVSLVWLFLPALVLVEVIFPVTWAYVGDTFGRRRFATLRGVVTSLVMVGPVIGPVWAGRVWDTRQSYTLVLQVFLVLFIVSSAIFCVLPRPGRGAPAPPART
ncbi:MAG: MFS transporter [Chloroflexi bacterium]|nr:MFS transporter [Chloroflexota bacterium]